MSRSGSGRGGGTTGEEHPALERQETFARSDSVNQTKKKRRQCSVIAQNPLFPGSKSTFQHTAQRQTAFLKILVYIQLQPSVIKVAK